MSQEDPVSPTTSVAALRQLPWQISIEYSTYGSSNGCRAIPRLHVKDQRQPKLMSHGPYHWLGMSFSEEF
ncbi:hypothetical protein E2562_000576 [Oryza meyeriana var. granulata]|uniref:Uncharacterized protein n=1 Tax=Oryza meyeriana var. granulata TaxID=110450 RepID=A0A6G1DTW2_9ORYZ|nr:hypothetical protein E2562_000576 [Oryza meyeriana var. granulata]